MSNVHVHAEGAGGAPFPQLSLLSSTGIGDYRSVSLTSIPGKVMEQRALEAVSKHAKCRKVTGSSQHGFTKGKSFLSDLIVTHDTMTSSVHQNRVSGLSQGF